MTALRTANGTSEVKLTPLADAGAPDPMLGRYSIDKQAHGNLEGTATDGSGGGAGVSAARWVGCGGERASL